MFFEESTPMQPGTIFKVKIFNGPIVELKKCSNGYFDFYENQWMLSPSDAPIAIYNKDSKCWEDV